MENYLEKGKEVLKVLINNGCEAYMIGEAVYNLIQGLPFSKIDITTNATPEMVKGIFANAKVEDEHEGAVRLTYMGYIFIVSTFRLEEKFKDNRTPMRWHYSKNLKDELAARDFTISAIAMSYGGKLTDAYRGYEDIKRKRVRTIGSPKVRFSESPLRILIALRLVSELGFKLERKTKKAMRRRAKLLKSFEPSDIEIELTRIFAGPHFKRALKYMVNLNIHKYVKDLKKGLDYLADNYKRISSDSILACSYVLNKSYSPTWDNLTDDPQRLRDVVELALLNPRSKYNPYLLFKYGLEVYLDSNYVNYMLKKSRNRKNKITQQYANLPIKSMDEVEFPKNDFYLLARDASKYYEVIMKDVVSKILENQLDNDYFVIRDYVKRALSVYNVNLYEEGEKPQQKVYREYDDYVYEQEQKPVVVEERVEVTPVYHQEESHMPLSTFEQIQRKVLEFEKTLREKDERIKELEKQALEYKLDSDVNTIVGQNLEILRDLNYLEKGTEKLMFSRELKEVYKDLIKNVDPKFRLLDDKKKEDTDEH